MTLVCLAADKKTTHSGNEEASDDEVDYDDDDEHAPSFYDKSKSFFDNISCNASEKAQGYVAHSDIYDGPKKLDLRYIFK